MKDSPKNYAPNLNGYNTRLFRWPSTLAYNLNLQETQLSQRGSAMLRATEYFAKSLKITQDYSKW